MRHIRICIIAWLTLAHLPIQAIADTAPTQAGVTTGPLHVLFIGNSYTYVNKMPSILSALAASANSPRRIQTQMVAEPAATLQLLWEKGAAEEAIRGRKWDFVVLQEQSVLPTVEPERMNYYARKFDYVIKKNGARTVLFLTWARRGNPEMQRELNNAYLNLARELGAQIAPVGPAWQLALAAAPSTQLHMEDGSHPTPAGSYLAACVFFHVVFENQQSCPSIERSDISKEDFLIAKNAASQAVTKIR